MEKDATQIQRLLIVDDEQNITSSLTEVFTCLGYQIETAKNGEEALSMLSENSYDHIILDLNIPGPDGLKVLEEFSSRHTSTPITVITALRLEAILQRCYQLGASRVLTKPFEIEDLIEAVTQGQHVEV